MVSVNCWVDTFAEAFILRLSFSYQGFLPVNISYKNKVLNQNRVRPRSSMLRLNVLPFIKQGVFRNGGHIR
jgi:hypothetical protein